MSYPSPKPFSLSRKTVNLWPGQILGKGQVQLCLGYRRSHCQPFCGHMSTQLEWIHACILLIKINCLVKIFCVSHLSVFNSNNLGTCPEFYSPSGKPPPSPLQPPIPTSCLSLGRSVLLLGCGGPWLWPPATTFWICKWTQTQNFLTTQVKELWRQGPQWLHKFVHSSRQEMSQGWPSNVLVFRILEAVWCVNEMCQVTWREIGVLICSSEVTSYCFRRT
jgi:hypothetical protein